MGFYEKQAVQVYVEECGEKINYSFMCYCFKSFIIE